MSKIELSAKEISLPKNPHEVLARYPAVIEAITTLEKEGFPIFSFDASLGDNSPLFASCCLTHKMGLVSLLLVLIPILVWH